MDGRRSGCACLGGLSGCLMGYGIGLDDKGEEEEKITKSGLVTVDIGETGYIRYYYWNNMRVYKYNLIRYLYEMNDMIRYGTCRDNRSYTTSR